MKYIFVTGAPGSKWSSVAKNIYHSPDIDRSDSRTDWQYTHQQVSHEGAYFDPGMELSIPQDLSGLNRTELEQIFDQPFDPDTVGCRIIKSHVFALNIDYLRQTFPDAPLVLVHRDNDACLSWWTQAGGFDIGYPNYRPYYQDFATMANRIAEQNRAIQAAWWAYDSGQDADTNQDLAEILGLTPPPAQYQQHYSHDDVRVRVIK